MKALIYSFAVLLVLADCSNKKTEPDLPAQVLVEGAIEGSNEQIEPQIETVGVPDPATGPYYGNPFRAYSKFLYLHKIAASSQLSDYPAENLVDRTWRSWAEGSEGNGIGESFTISLKAIYAVTGFALKNGYGNLDYYSKNNRVKSFKIYVDDKYFDTIPIKDSISFEQYAFEKPAVGHTLRFVIDDIYPGTDYNDTCIAEIALSNWIVSGRDFYENILAWLSTIDEESLAYYENNSEQIVSVPDTDRLKLLDYLPFDTPLVEEIFSYRNSADSEWLPRKTKISLLDTQSSLKLYDDLPRIDGATAMYPLYSAFVRAVYPETEMVLSKKARAYSVCGWAYFPNIDILRDRFFEFDIIYPGIELKSIVQCNTTSEAYRRLIDGEADIIFCYEPSEAEKNAAAEKGKRLNLTPIAKDAFVFIVNGRNALNNITRGQVRDIYSGRITNWRTISGIDEPIIAYQRPENSGSQTIFQSIMKGESLMRPVLDSEVVPRGMLGMLRNVASDYYNYNAAIGYTFLFYLAQMSGGSGVKALAIDGIMPTRQTIQNNTYPFVQTVYAITAGNESENTKKFIEWILSAQGQGLAAKTGYTPIKQ